LTQAFWPAVQGESAVRVANCAFSFCAATPLASLKPPEPEDDAAGVDAAGAGAAAELGAGVESSEEDEDEGAGAAADEPAALLEDDDAEPEEDPGVPGLVVISTNWEPSAMGPPGFAGQLPGGLKGLDWPKGMVPGEPTGTGPLGEMNVLVLVDWNWHWKRPFNSGFFGACWQ